MIFLFISCQNSNSLILIGHRGARGYVAENTLASISKAIELGVDGVEIDVFLCASGELIVFHDKTLEKLTNGIGAVESFTLDSLKTFKVLGEETIPTLNEVMEFIDSEIILNIELKGSNTAIPTAKLLKHYFSCSLWSPEKVFISSFNWEELRIFSKQKTEVDIAILTDKDPLNSISIAKEINAIAINPDYRSLNSENVLKIQNHGIKIFPWTVNSYEDINKMKLLGVDGIITDYPDRVKSK